MPPLSLLPRPFSTPVPRFGPRRFVGFPTAGGPIATPSPIPLAGLVVAPNVEMMRTRGLLWQDSGMTVPAVADNDTVVRAVCPFTGLVGVQSGTAITLKVSGGLSWLEATSNATRLRYTVAASGGTIYAASAMTQGSTPTNFGRSLAVWDAASDTNTGSTIPMLRSGVTANVVSIGAGGGYGGTMALANDTDAVIESYIGGGNGVTRLDNNADTSNPKTITLAATVVDFFNGADGVGIGSRLYGAMVATAIPADRAAIRTYLAALQGRSL